MITLGAIYALGCDGVPRNCTYPTKLFTDAADLNESEAILYLFWMVFSAKENDGALTAVVERVRKAADNNIPQAMFLLGFLHQGGVKNVPLDQPQAMQLFAKAATLGDTRAMIAHARQLFKIDVKNSVGWCVKAIAAGNANGYFALALFYRARDPETSFGYLQMGAEAGDFASMAMLAEDYRMGRGELLAKDVAKAKDLFEKCSDECDAYSTEMLGRMAEDDKRYVLAVSLYKKSIAQGAANSSGIMVSIAKLYENGLRELPSRLKRAVKWLRKAAELGNKDAMAQLAAKFAMGTGIVKDGREAARWTHLCHSDRSYS
jgi:hypothetical protein